jgi:hypothetical protein
MEWTLPIVLLAQVFEPAMPQITPTPRIERWVTGSGIPLAALLGVFAVVAFLVLSRGERARLAWPASGLLFAAAGLALLAGHLVVTHREVLRDAARTLVDRTVAADKNALGLLLHEDARLRSRFGNADGRDRIIAFTDLARMRIESHRVREVRVDMRGPRVARTQIRVSVTADRIPPASWWAVDWQRTTDDSPWQVTNIEPLWLQGMGNPVGP